MEEIVSFISSVGFPIVACYFMYKSNQNELKTLRDAVEENTEATLKLSTTVQILHGGDMDGK